MDHILGAPFRHVAVRTAARSGMPAFCCRPLELASMATLASCVIVPHRRLAARDIMRVMARPALHRALALEKAARFPHAVYGVHQFELVVATGLWRMVEEQP